MSTTPELVDHYKLHPLDPGKAPILQPLVFKSWKRDSNDPNSKPPPRTDLTQPVAVESKRFPNQYLQVIWVGAARNKPIDPDEKTVVDFATLLFAERTATAASINRVNKVR